MSLAVLIAWAGDAAALGLGELRTRSALGEPFLAEVDVLTNGKEIVDVGCFKLRAPQDDSDLPWLQGANLSLRKKPNTVLEIRSSAPLRDPVLQVGLSVGCGHEVQRDYTLFLSPRGKDAAAEPPVAPPAVPAPAERPAPRLRPRVAAEAGEAPPSKEPPRRSSRRAKLPPLPDRLVLFGIGEAAGDPSLRLSTDLSGWKEEAGDKRETQRQALRLEYRLLAMMNEQATSQLAAAEKLRNMEAALAELRQHTGELAGRIEKGVTPPSPAEQSATSPEPVAPQDAAPAAVSGPKAASRAKPVGEAQPRQTLFSEWSFYGIVLGVVLGIGGWLGWRQYRDRRGRSGLFDEPVPPVIVDARRPTESEDFGGVDFHIGQAVATAHSQVDLPLDMEPEPRAAVAAPPKPGATPHSIADATVDEHFEVNPVMELAEIMLSFGRVKGAAQALQEYIDHNPEEALQPWIRLMDVYRMAGMREEFDRLAQDLNRHFNVEVQEWESTPRSSLDKPLDFILDADAALASSAVAKAQTVEDMEHIRNRLIECWGTQECLDYLNQLLRDNRGGKRSGFALPVVEEILFLIELLGTRKTLEKDSA